jgi:truncated hemoglobin YjbI
MTMRCLCQGKCLLALLLALTALRSAHADDKARAAKPLPRRVLDEAVYDSLRNIIDQGAPMYNMGDWNGCYRLWEGALLGIRPLLDHRPALQTAIDDALTNARQDPMLWHRAWVLRPALDKIRADIDADYPHAKKAKDKSSAAAPPSTKKTMWDRLGGEAGVTRLVDDFVNLVAKDAKVDFFRHNKYKLDADQIVKMKREFVEQISAATGGPLKYTGPDMKKVHKGMGITEAQYDAAAADLKQALEKNKVAADDVKKILEAVNGYRKEIVEPKKPEEKKPAAKEEKPKTLASIQGKVLYKGKPAAGAKISLVAADGKAVGGAVAEDGSYEIATEPGEYKVVVTDPAKLGLPAAYANVKTSALKFVVKKGNQIFDVELK